MSSRLTLPVVVAFLLGWLVMPRVAAMVRAQVKGAGD